MHGFTARSGPSKCVYGTPRRNNRPETGACPGVTALQRSSPFFVALQSSISFSFSAPALQYIPLLHAPTIFCLALQRSKQFKIKAPALQPIFLSFPALQLVFLSSSTLALQPFFSLRSGAPVTFSVALQRSRTPLDRPTIPLEAFAF